MNIRNVQQYINQFYNKINIISKNNDNNLSSGIRV